MLKIILVTISLATLVSCALDTKEEAKKTARTTSAQDRINASKSGADIITKELDNVQ